MERAGSLAADRSEQSDVAWLRHIHLPCRHHRCVGHRAQSQARTRLRSQLDGLARCSGAMARPGTARIHTKRHESACCAAQTDSTVERTQALGGCPSLVQRQKCIVSPPGARTGSNPVRTCGGKRFTAAPTSSARSLAGKAQNAADLRKHTQCTRRRAMAKGRVHMGPTSGGSSRTQGACMRANGL